MIVALVLFLIFVGAGLCVRKYIKEKEDRDQRVIDLRYKDRVEPIIPETEEVSEDQPK